MCNDTKRGICLAEVIIALVVVMLAILMPNNDLGNVYASGTWVHDDAGNDCDYFAFSYSWQPASEPRYYETAVMNKVGVYSEGYIAPGETFAVSYDRIFDFSQPEITMDGINTSISKPDLINIERYASRSSNFYQCWSVPLAVLNMALPYDYNISGREVGTLSIEYIYIYGHSMRAHIIECPREIPPERYT